MNPFGELRRWWKHKKRRQKAKLYLSRHSDDEVTVAAILLVTETQSVGNPREAAEFLARRKLDDDDWDKISPRWERAWDHVIQN